ncbi:hypothetical protein CKO28_14245 [Rhodovibrio sodomensis]|uniref:Uncharacterized protein n=1 Tax=Rhodovibrio sodomensis TaxID=1088 RepID=A0ABS1DG30_9PROT|nr:hypothetical protein [Rhodovibrio sodomensis]MBK1669194.1 hypothetical protein [Rhodovibrio sodomensis]
MSDSGSGGLPAENGDRKDPVGVLAEYEGVEDYRELTLGEADLVPIVDDYRKRRRLIDTLRALPPESAVRQAIIYRCQTVADDLRGRAKRRADRAETVDVYIGRMAVTVSVSGAVGLVAGSPEVSAAAYLALVGAGVAGMAYAAVERYVSKREENDSIEAAKRIERMIEAVERPSLGDRYD